MTQVPVPTATADIESYQFKNRKAPRFIYASMSGEIDNGPEYWGDEWKTGWERVSAVLKDKAHFPENTVTSVHTFPGYGHYNGFMPSLTAALNDYIVFGAKNLVSYVGEETYPVHIELRGKNLTDTIYITGNQDALGNWEAKGVKMTLTSDSIASIDLHLHLPAQFKFTRGSWEARPLFQMPTRATSSFTMQSTPTACTACGREISGWENKIIKKYHQQESSV